MGSERWLKRTEEKLPEQRPGKFIRTSEIQAKENLKEEKEETFLQVFNRFRRAQVDREKKDKEEKKEEKCGHTLVRVKVRRIEQRKEILSNLSPAGKGRKTRGKGAEI